MSDNFLCDWCGASCMDFNTVKYFDYQICYKCNKDEQVRDDIMVLELGYLLKDTYRYLEMCKNA